MSSILIAEDEERIAAFVQKGLRAAGYRAEIVRDGIRALEEALTGRYDLILLDIGLPGLDGFEVLRRLRADGIDAAVIIVTARDSAVDTVTGLEGGANDYISKPFRFDELLARVRVRLRDVRGDRAMPVLRSGGLQLDVRSRQVLVDGRPVDLSPREYALAEEFLRHPGEVLTREELLQRVWGYDHDPGTNVVDVYVRYLRNKIGAERVQTVRGLGYRYDASDRVDDGPAG